MRPVPWWALLPSVCAPVLLIGGWTIAAILVGPAYDPATQTISVLAAYGSAGFWVMNGALFALGICHLLTALGLRAAALAGRVALACGGVSALVVVLLPAPSSGGSLRHGSAAAVGFTLLAVWPVLAADRTGAAPWGLRPAPSLAATALMGAGALWFMIEINRHGAAGVAERLSHPFSPCGPWWSCPPASATPAPSAMTTPRKQPGHAGDTRRPGPEPRPGNGG